MRWVAALLVLSACDQVLGLTARDGDQPADGATEPPTDVRVVTCPPLGQAPAFLPVAHQVVAGCGEWTTGEARTRAMALCGSRTAEGPVDGPFTPVPDLLAIGTAHIDVPRLAPEGDLVLVRHWDESTLFAQIRAYQGSSSSFLPAFDVTLAGRRFDTSVRFGTPSKGPARRMFLRDPSIVLAEIEIDAAGTGTIVASYVESQLGIDSIYQAPNLSPDGLRAIFLAQYQGTGRVVYMDRASLSDRFRPVLPVAGIPAAAPFDAFMTGECERVYYSSAGSLFWVEQR